MKFKFIVSIKISLLLLVSCSIPVFSQSFTSEKDLDQRVKTFLDSRQGKWSDLNIPASDGKILYDLIVTNNLKSALEIGTSTGHSGIWIAWALSKTGGKLITIEIDESRHKQAVTNFEEAGLSQYIDAKLADAHALVEELPGPFDFVFTDADKGWYKNYFVAIDPKLKPGGIYTAHNVYESNKSGSGTIASFVNFILNHPDYTTSFNETGNGISISRKTIR